MLGTIERELHEAFGIKPAQRPDTGMRQPGQPARTVDAFGFERYLRMDVDAYVDAIVERQSDLHDNLLALASHYVAKGPLLDADIIALLQDIMERVPEDVRRPDWRSRYTDIPRTVAYASKRDAERAVTDPTYIPRVQRGTLFFNDSVRPGVASCNTIKPSPYVWRDPASLPPREFVYGVQYIRKFVSATVAPGGLGKSSLKIAEAVDMASGRGFLHPVQKPLRVWYWCGEDPLDELEKRVAAVHLHHRIDPRETAGRLFLDSGRDLPIRLVEEAKGETRIAVPIVTALIDALKAAEIDVLIVDPFVATHRVSENDNSKIDSVVDQWKAIADGANVSVEIVHHVRKGQMGQSDYTTDDARGAKALVDATRSTAVLNLMSDKDAQLAGIQDHERPLHFRVDNGKRNMVPPSQKAVWRRLVSVPLGNGDYVQAVEAWEMPGIFADVTERHLSEVQRRLGTEARPYDKQAADWVGHLIGEVTGIELDDGGRQRVGKILDTWIANGAFKVSKERNKAKGRDHQVVRTGALA